MNSSHPRSSTSSGSWSYTDPTVRRHGRPTTLGDPCLTALRSSSRQERTFTVSTIVHIYPGSQDHADGRILIIGCSANLEMRGAAVIDGGGIDFWYRMAVQIEHSVASMNSGPDQVSMRRL